jgi:adenylate cyclase
MKIIKYRLVLILTLISCLCGARQDVHGQLKLTDSNYYLIDLDTLLWKFKPGDSLQWAAKDLNDSAWLSTIPVIRSLEQNNKIGFKGIGWFRLSFHADSTLMDKPLMLQFVSTGAAGLYLDGKIIRHFGTIKNSEASEYVKPIYPATFTLHDTGMHVIAIRYENRHYEALLKSWSGNNAGFSTGLSEYDVYFEGKKQSTLFLSLFLLISGGVFFALFLSHLVMYFFHRRYIANLIFSIFNLGIGLFFIAIYIYGYIEPLRIQVKVLPVFTLAPAVSFAALSLLVNTLFFRSRLRIIIGCLFLLVVAVTTFIDFHVAVSFVLLYLAYTIVEAAIVVIIAVRRKIPGSRILSFGILCSFLLFAFLAVFGTLGKLEFEGDTGIIILALCMLSIFCLPLSMSAYLAWSFALVNKNLTIQLGKVNELSQKTLEQEQEKQRLLENQKEDLERQVALRTGELVQQKEALVIEKKKSDDLLLNILPAEVAEELKETGNTKAQYFDQVSVLFTDFVNFTQISERLSPEALVQELDECFRAFDEIIERNGLEKIKTIGDAYLAVSGMPVYKEQHAVNAARAALEIIACIDQRKKEGHAFEVRIGIHSGPLVAGIVGVKKFAYDIWGDTVNTASRMESSGEAGKLNISETTYQLVKEHFACTYRGKVDAKNKGAMDMYFVAENKGI